MIIKRLQHGNEYSGAGIASSIVCVFSQFLPQAAQKTVQITAMVP